MRCTKRNQDGTAALLPETDVQEAIEVLARLEEAAAEVGLETPEDMIVILRHEQSSQTAQLWLQYRVRINGKRQKEKQEKRANAKRKGIACRELRWKLNLKARDMEREVGLSKNYIHKIERGGGSPDTADKALKLLCKKAGWNWWLFEKLVIEDADEQELAEYIKRISAPCGDERTEEKRER